MYIFSSDFLLTLNLRTLKILSLVQTLFDMLLACSVHVHVLEKVRLRCLWLVVSSMIVTFIKREGFWTGFNLRDNSIDKVLLRLNVTSQELAYLEIVCKSALRTLVACSGMPSIMYKLVSSANKRIEPSIRLTMSLI